MDKSNNTNILEPLVDSLLDTTALVFKLIPKVYDTWGNIIYWLVEGKKYEEVEEIESIETENIKMYEFLPTENFEKVVVDNTIKYQFIEGEKEGIKVCVGEDLDGNKVTIDILEGNMLIGGMTGGGKSNLLNVIITNIMRTYTRNEVNIYGCDLAMADVYYFYQYEHFVSMSTNHKGFLKQLEMLETKINERAKILQETNCRSAINYNKKYDKKMSYILFIVDELVLLTDNADCKKKLHNVMGNSRKYGVYWIVAGQDATKETIGRCKMNCPQVIGLKTFDETDSNTLLGKNQNLHEIDTLGRCKIKNKNGITETQIYYIDEDTIDRVLEPFKKVDNTNTQ